MCELLTKHGPSPAPEIAFAVKFRLQIKWSVPSTDQAGLPRGKV